MKKRILAYLAYIDHMLESDEEQDWEKQAELHLTQIRFFAHERLVHLLVFILVAICTVMCILAFVLSSALMILPLIVMLFVLLVPYCMHYYLLENSVQRMYQQYDEMIGKTQSYFSMKKG
jgi:Flp pilus assembly protein TadB